MNPEDFQRDITIELGIVRPRDLSHTAFADRRGHVVDAESGASCEGQR